MYQFDSNEKERLLKNCHAFFVEVADGIYHIEKDRLDFFCGEEFCSPQHVVVHLNDDDIITVVERRGLQRKLISNYHFA